MTKKINQNKLAKRRIRGRKYLSEVILRRHQEGEEEKEREEKDEERNKKVKEKV